MRIAVEHVTRYCYVEEVPYSIQLLKLTPPEFAGQQVLSWQIEGHPRGLLSPSRDGFGNLTHLMTVEAPHREIEIRACGLVDVENRNGIVAGLVEPVPLRVYLRHTPLTWLGGEEAAGLMAAAPADAGKDRIGFLHALMGGIRDRIDYTPGVTSSATTAAEALAAGQGVCQDHTHVFIAASRAAGIPARYVTGYMLLDSDHAAEAHHAWAEAWVDDLGWLAFDVANRLCPTDRYVRMTCGLDAHYAAPIRGSRRGKGDEALEVEVRVAQAMVQQ